MPNEYAMILLALAALLTGGLYLMTRRRRKKKKSAPPVRPAAPTNQTAGVAATWAPPTPARPQTVAPTMVAPPPGTSGWGAPAPAKLAQGGWGSPASPAVASNPPSTSPSWGAAPAAPARLPDRAIVESSGGSGRGCGSAGSRSSCRTGVGRLGCTASFGPRLAADRRAVLGQPGRGVVGHPQDRRTRRTAGAILGC